MGWCARPSVLHLSKELGAAVAQINPSLKEQTMIMPKRPCICPVQMSFHFASYMQLRLRAASRWDSAVPRAIGNEMVSPTLALRACAQKKHTSRPSQVTGQTKPCGQAYGQRSKKRKGQHVFQISD